MPKIELIYFSAAGCSVCHAVWPRIQQLAADYGVELRKIQTEQEIEFSAQNLVFTVPTVLLFFEGREVQRESRFIDFDRLKRQLSIMTDSSD
jgi:thioredoxin-like negative regulator of GroEL